MKKVKKQKEASSSEKQGFTDLVGIDFSKTATKVVRLTKNKDKVSCVEIDLLPAVDFSASTQLMELTQSFATNYACLAYSGTSAIVRMINAPLPKNELVLSDNKLRDLLNVEENYRVSARLVKNGGAGKNSSFLAAAIPLADVNAALNLFAFGPPAATSLEVSGLAYISAFLHAHGDEVEDEAVCLIEAGEATCYFAFLVSGVVMLVGKVNSGGIMIRKKVASDLGVDDELAKTIIKDLSINISGAVLDVMSPFLKQLSMSKDFVERQQSRRVSKIYVSGGVSLLPPWTAVVEQYLGARVIQWNPFKNIQCDPDLFPADLAEQAPRFAAAIGAAIGGLKDQ